MSTSNWGCCDLCVDHTFIHNNEKIVRYKKYILYAFSTKYAFITINLGFMGEWHHLGFSQVSTEFNFISFIIVVCIFG